MLRHMNWQGFILRLIPYQYARRNLGVRMGMSIFPQEITSTEYSAIPQ